MSRPGTKPWSPWWKASTQEKIHSNSLLIAFENIYYIRERAQWRMLATAKSLFIRFLSYFLINKEKILVEEWLPSLPHALVEMDLAGNGSLEEQRQP
jgi:hypothetical protein